MLFRDDFKILSIIRSINGKDWRWMKWEIEEEEEEEEVKEE